ncbi:helix-turn-helix domain-containing protein [Lentilactobacillus parafarraginis]|uniref:Helix-turn-helix domain-containing protein n=2 Tax=Lentilactobacillus parafarraginis TaxID=390842 RepID=A0A5R9CST2_9LACO|nr:AraC family transcriptional regulator [Lentilactobacillus parafarraginis]TLQ18426.1 helix-turn-helix domain-containing protein [Lentilactobacillus parafarraginis]
MKCFVSSTDIPVIFRTGGKFTTDSSWEFDKVCGDTYELIIGIKGLLFVTIDGTSYAVRPDNALLIPPQAVVQGSSDGGGLSFLWLRFCPKAHSEYADIKRGRVKQYMENQGCHLFALPTFSLAKNIERLIVMCHTLLTDYPSDAFQSEEQNLTMMYILLKISSQFYEKDQQALPGEVRTRRIKTWILEHMCADLSVDDVSTQFGLSQQYLSRIFREFEGKTVFQYINEQRTAVAQYLLCETHLSVKEIIGYSYFQNERQFLLQFKKVTGMTPSKFREAFGGIHRMNPQIDMGVPLSRRAKALVSQLETLPDRG